AVTPPDLQPQAVGLRCRSTRPTTLLPFHLTYDHVLSGCAAVPTNLTLLPFHPTYDFAAAPTDLQPRAVGLRCRSTRPTTFLPPHS
ncbi:MAG TPA: hypothetical protein PKL60_00050, partial [Anaerolineaceae bacterium]|nr:hypothetical protein [Anaerolineaceae bacterium]